MDVMPPQAVSGSASAAVATGSVPAPEPAPVVQETPQPVTPVDSGTGARVDAKA